MLFIFSIHPYDVGDLVLIGMSWRNREQRLLLSTSQAYELNTPHTPFCADEVHMFVTEFGLFSTTFQRVDGQVVVAPNSLLISKKHIINIRRSGSMWETVSYFKTDCRFFVASNLDPTVHLSDPGHGRLWYSVGNYSRISDQIAAICHRQPSRVEGRVSFP
jgi:hypothetical protein